jgi:hypothetical protein
MVTYFNFDLVLYKKILTTLMFDLTLSKTMGLITSSLNTANNVITQTMSNTHVESVSETKTQTSKPTVDEIIRDHNEEISGCGIALIRKREDGKKGISVFEENRVFLTEEEQEKIGSAQPYMLGEQTLNAKGEVMSPIELGKLIYQKKNKIKTPVDISDEEATEFYQNARDDFEKFKNRYFQMAVYRERRKKSKDKDGNKKYENLDDMFRRLLKEELLKKLKEGCTIPKVAFADKRPGGSSYMLVYIVNDDILEDDQEAIQEKGKSNYFCSKALPGVCNNDFYETRDRRFMLLNDVENLLTKCATNFKNYDTSRWGAKRLFEAVKPHL